MRNYLFLLMFLSIGLKAQGDKIDLKSLEMSNAPSIILLGISPTELESPKTKKAIILSLVNSFKKGNGVLDNYAVEITPFWLFPSKRIDALKYVGINSMGKQNIFNDIQKTSFSIAYSKDLKLNPDSGIETPSFSVGLSSRILNIRSKDNRDKIIDLTATIEDINRKLSVNFIKNIEPEIFKKCKLDGITDVDCKKIRDFEYNKFINTNDQDSIEKEKQKELDNYKLLIDAAPIFSVDFATAYSTFFSDNKFANNHFGKLGFWMTLSSGIDFTDKEDPKIEKKLNFYGIARYLEDGTTLSVDQQFLRTRNFDFGGKAEFVYNRFSISYEYIYRVNEIENTFRSSGLLAYKISDKVYINAAFGKNYGNKDNLISFLGLNWGLDSERKSVFVEEKKTR
ncbi:hypothetical protein [uncultured Chryseobacterium sp.]|uniref:hypothetical protein n=1 Tax=uncultured Chryseobacterium sp. TaxID=259322 RepID=UPI0025F96090|nr:hypothetical protein [uncultured Chryseobacterium sp.]